MIEENLVIAINTLTIIGSISVMVFIFHTIFLIAVYYRIRSITSFRNCNHNNAYNDTSDIKNGVESNFK